MTITDYWPKWLAIFVALFVALPLFNFSPTTATSGGPDNYGYIWVDSRSPSPIVAYNWIDILSSGILLTLPNDGCTYEISLNFQFRFYGAISSEIFICTNGFITFGVPDSFYADPPIPDPQRPNNRIVALGIDLYHEPGTVGGIYFKSFPSTTPRRFIISWIYVNKAYTTNIETFQIILEQSEMSKDGRIIFQYKSLTGLTSTPLIGIENSTGSSGLTYPGPLGNGLAVAFLPPTDAELPPDTLQVAWSALAPSTVAQGVKDVPMLRLEFSTPSNDVYIRAIQVRLSGLGAGPEDVSFARFWLDDGDGIFNSGPPDIVLVEAKFEGSPPVVRLELSSPLHVNMTNSKFTYISYDISSTADVDDWIGARLQDAASISVEYPDIVSSMGFPIETYSTGIRTLVVASQDTLTLVTFTPCVPSMIEQWTTDIPVLSLQFSVNQNNVDLSGIRIGIGGNASATDIWAAKILYDLDLDRNYTPGTDDVLATGIPSGSPASAQFNFSLRVVAGSSVTLLVLIDVAPDAVINHVMNVTINKSDIILPMGSIDLIANTSFPAESGNAIIISGSRPALRLPWLSWPPRPNGIWRENEYLLNPDSTIPLNRPAGNRVPGYLTTENNDTHLFLAIDATEDVMPDFTDGITIGFDTDANGSPTPNADDVFAVNATDGIHLRYNSGAGTWTSIGPCLPAPPIGDITEPSCAAGIGVTAFKASPHRFYEFAIPLAFLGIPTPIPPNTFLRFALAAPPYDGLTDAGNRSTWPLLFDTLLPLTHYGDLVLARGPTPNRFPGLNWVGDTGYESDGLDPETGLWNATFTWRISYSDPDNDPPAFGQPLLHVLQSGLEIGGSPFAMSPENISDLNYLDGKLYKRWLIDILCDVQYSYYFTVRDARGLVNSTSIRMGPVVYCPDQPPVLLGGIVSPITGIAGDSFTYRVVYRDAEGLPPKSIQAFVLWGDINLTSFPLNNMGWIGDPGNYSAGAFFGAALVLTNPGTNYSFKFRASDDNNTVDSATLFGPYVLASPPDILNVAFVDLAPLTVDEGTNLVPFLQIYLITSSPEVKVTSLRIDRIGTATIAEVDKILLYHDIDSSGSLTGSDQLLGVQTPVSGTETFPISLEVTPSTPASLLFLLNLTRPGTPDESVGLEVKDSTYVTVGPDDRVQSFATFRTTCSLINVAPQVFNLTVDGYPSGSEGIRHILSDAPILEWQFEDANDADLVQIAYNVSVYSVSPSVLLWSRNETGSVTSITYAGPVLSNGSTYLIDVSASDGRLWSALTESQFRMNTAPPIPTPLSPVNGTIDVNPNVTLLWQPVTDADGDSVTYYYWISDNDEFRNAVEGVAASPSITLNLTPGTTYFWKLGASDGWEFAGNTTVWQFTTAGIAPPGQGEVRGRVMDENMPLPGALVELLTDDSVIQANVTGDDGTFQFIELDLRLYTVRVSAYEFQTRTLTVEPEEDQPIVDLGDITLTRIAVDDTSSTIPFWSLLLTILFSLILGVFLTIFVFWFQRRWKRKESKTASSEEVKIEEQEIDESFSEEDKG